MHERNNHIEWSIVGDMSVSVTGSSRVGLDRGDERRGYKAAAAICAPRLAIEDPRSEETGRNFAIL